MLVQTAKIGMVSILKYARVSTALIILAGIVTMGTTDNGHYNNGNLNNGDSNNREFDNGISFDKGNRSGSHDKRNFNNGMILMTMTTPSIDIVISMQCCWWNSLTAEVLGAAIACAALETARGA